MNHVKKASSGDGFAFKCLEKCCAKYKTSLSIRTNSFLRNYSVDLRKFLHFVYLYSLETSQKNICEVVGLSESLVYKLIKDLQHACFIYFKLNPIKLGGPGVVLQIDESKFNHNVKSHRGRSPAKKTWVFGIVDTSFKPARGFMTIVEKRSKEILIPIISEHAIPSSIIYSDEWAAYDGLFKIGYTHKTVCHKYHFKDPITAVHTQHVESYWNRQKNRIKKMLGIKRTSLSGFLLQFMFFDWFVDDVFNAILTHLVKV